MSIFRGAMGSDGGGGSSTGTVLKQAQQMAALERRIDKLTLVCEALWSILKERTGLTEEELARRITELDLRDGKLDGRYVTPPSLCPKCGSTMSKQFDRCLFCGVTRPDGIFD